MSTTFTKIIDGLDWTNVSFLDEIINAYDERAQAIPTSNIPYPIVAGTDIQNKYIWAGIQAWLETNCVNYVNHTLTLNGLTATDFAFTLTTWRAVAGLDSSGFRRATNWDPLTNVWTNLSDPMYTPAQGGGFGNMVAGDIIGPWIIDDLQKAFTALKWTFADAYNSTSNVRKGFENGVSYADCDTAYASGYNVFVNDAWSNTYGVIYVCYAEGYYMGGKYGFGAGRVRGAPKIDSIPVFCQHSTDFYLIPEKYGATFASDPAFPLQDGKLYFIESFAEALASSVTATIVGDTETVPLDVLNINCLNLGNIGVWCNLLVILKWDGSNGFTYNGQTP